MKKLIYLILIVLIPILISPVIGFANSNANVTFEWDANTEGDLAGYRLYRADVPGSYTFGEGNQVDGALAGTETVTILEHDGVWYYVLTAYDNAGNESGPSNEVSTSIDTISPDAPGGLRITIIVNINQ